MAYEGTSFSQLLGGLGGRQDLGYAETASLLGRSISESDQLLKRATRGYGEATDRFGYNLGEYEEKGDQIGVLEKLLAPWSPGAAALIGFGLRRSRGKPKFKYDPESYAPGFEGREFGQEMGEDLLSSIEGTRRFAYQSLKNSTIADLLDTAGNIGESYALFGDDDMTIGEWLKRGWGKKKDTAGRGSRRPV